MSVSYLISSSLLFECKNITQYVIMTQLQQNRQTLFILFVWPRLNTVSATTSISMKNPSLHKQRLKALTCKAMDSNSSGKSYYT